ncbi:hypothetical protein [Rhizobium sp. RAF56]|uniref:hypothetical protein n=1 Tax=Rhizobium sp. RAF56 TaxID=3233062 RepID=UPI003F9A7936
MAVAAVLEEYRKVLDQVSHDMAEKLVSVGGKIDPDDALKNAQKYTVLRNAVSAVDDVLKATAKSNATAAKKSKSK